MVRSRRSGRAGVLVALVLAVAGCGLISGDPLADEQRELNRARRLWSQQEMQDYRFEARRICFCGTEFVAPVEVQVRDGVVSSVTYVESGEPVSEQYAGLWPRIDGLFDVVQDAIDQDAYRLRVEYDPELGFPRDISIDYQELMADEEMGYRVEGLQPLPRP